MSMAGRSGIIAAEWGGAERVSSGLGNDHMLLGGVTRRQSSIIFASIIAEELTYLVVQRSTFLNRIQKLYMFDSA